MIEAADLQTTCSHTNSVTFVLMRSWPGTRDVGRRVPYCRFGSVPAPGCIGYGGRMLSRYTEG